MGRGPKPTKGKAKPAVSRTSRKNEDSKVRDLEKRLAEALKDKADALGQLQTSHRERAEAQDQQVATAEILRVISTSPTDLQPVFETIAENAVRLCDAAVSGVLRFDGSLIHLVAYRNFSAAARAIAPQDYPMAPTRRRMSGRAILDRTVVHAPDVFRDPDYPQEVARATGWRSFLSVPMLREAQAIGAVTVVRTRPGPFSDRQIELLQTFADQAVIAIENVRLFKELEARNAALTESLEQQTATSELLRVISSSPTDVQPVFEAIVRSAVRLCNARFANIFRLENDVVHLAAHHNVPFEALEHFRHTFPQPLSQGGTLTAQAMRQGTVVHIHDVEAQSDVAAPVRALTRSAGYRTVLAVPILRPGNVVGAIGVGRSDVTGAPWPFSDKEIALLKTFADQAVIAIENVRLFNETKEALERQTATAEILRVISSSPTDLRPVLETVTRTAARLCDAVDAMIFRVDGAQLLVAAHHGPIPLEEPVLRNGMPLTLATVAGRTVLEARRIHVDDLPAAKEEFPEGSGYAQRLGYRTTLSVPLLRQGTPLGVITIRRREVRPFTQNQMELLQTFADQAVIAIENVRLFTELQEKNTALSQAHAQVSESLEQQTATSDILRVIAGSPTDLQPVLDALVESASGLCQAADTALLLVEGDQLRVAALHGYVDDGARISNTIHRDWVAGRAVVDARTVHVEDLANAEAEFPLGAAIAARFGHRTALAMPLLRKGVPIGALFLRRREVLRFSDKEIALLQTFADQAVIAIENVRLFNETKEALERQTATSGILRVISGSPTDIQPVLETIVEHAGRVCGAFDAVVFLVEGERLIRAAHRGPVPITDDSLSLPIDRDSVSGVAALDSRTVYVEDILASREFPRGREFAERSGFRTVVSVPLIREGAAIGTLAVRRIEVQAFTNQQIALLETFANQAVIAIENVRLFKELEEKNRALTDAHAQVTEALEQQTATADILRVISSSPTDIQPVFEAIAKSAVRLCKADYGSTNRLEGDVIHLVAQHGQSAQWLERAKRLFPHRLTKDLIAGGAMLDREVVHMEDMQSDTRFPTSRTLALTMAYRTALSVPMLRDSEPVGAIVVFRQEGRPFSEAEIGLLRTFADQAVIAIENARLFTELQARTQQLTQSVEQLTALGDVARAVSSTLDLETVLNTIVSRAIQLSGTDGGSVYEYDETTEEFALRASRALPEAYVEQVRDVRPRMGEGAVGRVAQTREPVQIADISDPAVYESRVRNILLQSGLRALLAIPLIAEDQLVGALIVMRKRRGVFASEEVALLQTFATQSALAIQNARLFREIEDKSRQLEVASQHKSEFLANMSHELRTPLNAIIGFSEVLSEKMFGELNEKQEEYSKDIHASGQHLLSLINDILDLSKIEAGRMELELSDFHLPTALDSALTLVRERAGRRGVALQMNVDDRLGQIQADERKVRQVVLNLLSNAIKFTPEGGRIEMRATPQDGLVEVSVTDTGVGIAPEDQEAVFEEFRQVGTADKKVEGTGLGLTLCRKFVELHGGRIWVKSQVGVGSTFTFTIPVRHGE